MPSLAAARGATRHPHRSRWVGKTRLGLQIATELLTDFADGVLFVSLAPLSDPDLVLPMIAQALGLVLSQIAIFILGHTPLPAL
ncbi:MAG: hypothetical protein ACJ8BW_36535 [Ktedonobacteraceae bacterium]